MDYIETMVESDLIYDGRIIKVKNDTVRLHTGAIAKREVVVHNGGVGVIPIDADGNAYLVRQFRYPFGESVLEIPAGKLEIGEKTANIVAALEPIAVVILLALCTAYLVDGSFNPFLYFRF